MKHIPGSVIGIVFVGLSVTTTYIDSNYPVVE
jgi:hypothetical protein